MAVQYIHLYETILAHYPVGIDGLDPTFQDYKGFKLLQRLKADKLQFRKFEAWKAFVNDLNSGKEILASSAETGLHDCCYSGTLLIKNERWKHITYIQELCFHVSVLGPYFFLYGKDTVILTRENDRLVFEPVITISPANHYEFLFDFVRGEIQLHFDHYHFVPYSLLSQRIKALSVGDTVRQDACIFQALFTNEDITKYKYEGSILYR